MRRISSRRAPSVAALMEIKDVTDEDAKAIRHAWHTVGNRAEARGRVNCILGIHGVEFLGIGRRSGADFHYCNAGDSYATTALFHGTTMRVGCYADPVEAGAVREA